MAQVTGRINLSARAFPFVSQNWGRTVIVSSSADNNFNRQVQSTTDVDHDVGVPQVYYMHNVMPHAQGFQSIAYDTICAAAVITPDLTFAYVLKLRDDLGNFALLGICTDGKWYVRESSGTGWVLVLTSAHPTYRVYVAYLNGITYIYQKVTGLYSYDWTGHALVAKAFIGLDSNIIDGITTSFGYLIAWSAINPGYNINLTAASTNVLSGLSPFTTPYPQVGDIVTGTLIPANTSILYIDALGGLVYLSNNATGTGATTMIKSSSPGGVFWSSTINELDFTPSLITGAGGGEVQAAAGPVTFCVTHDKGFIVYTTENAVGATYSGNTRYPFTFNDIVGCGGITSPDLLAQEGNTGNHYAYTTNGLQLVNMGSGTVALTDVTDFISGKLFEDFDDTTKTFTLTHLTQTMAKKICIVSSRYLIISYGITSLTHAIVYDLITQRYGKLKSIHTACFEVDPEIVGVITDLPRQAIGLLQTNGQCISVNFDVENTTSNGTLILGKYQYVRARNLILDEFWIETIYNQGTFACTVMTSLDGKTISSLDTPYLYSASSGQNHYQARSEGQNLSLLLQGQFHIESGVLAFNLGAKR